MTVALLQDVFMDTVSVTPYQSAKDSSWENFLIILIAIIVLALIVVTPIVLTGYIAKRIKSKQDRVIFILTILIILSAPFAFLFASGFIGISAARIERDHSISVPHSATNIQCDDGFVSMTTFADVGARASFQMSRDDLSTFLAQFKFLESRSVPNDPPDGFVHHPVPEHFGRVIFTFYGMSRDGNVMHVDVYDIDNAKVGVCLDTCWN